MSAAGPKFLKLPGVIAPYRLPSTTTKLTSSSRWPKNMMLALPCAATAGTLVRSPVSVSMGNSAISPFTVSTRCTLFWALVVAADSCSSVAASGRVRWTSSDDERTRDEQDCSEEGDEDAKEARLHDCIVVVRPGGQLPGHG